MKMFQVFLLVVAGAVLAYILFYFVGNFISLRASSGRLGVSSVCFGEKCFSVEVAQTNAEREKGLMYRKEMDENKGMLFIFDNEGIYPFWMKNTLISLDMVWIDGNNKVVFIGKNVQPCENLICPSVIPTAKAKYVLEVNAGVCDKIGLKIGDTLTINK